MPIQNPNPIEAVDEISGRALVGAEALFAELRARMARAANITNSGDIGPYIGFVSRVLQRARPLLIDHIADTQLASWVAGMNELAKQFPLWLLEEFLTGIRQPPPPGSTRFFFFEDQPRLRFPLLEKAAENLARRKIMTREQWDSVTEKAQRDAFFITGDIAEQAIEKVRDELVEDINAGTSLGSFSDRVEDILSRSAIGPARLETIYRTNVQSAFRDGRETLASDPVVTELFPYQEYIPIRDARTRHDHAELGKLGLSGTAIYRRDDPMWDHFTPPWDYNCRCGVRLLTIEAAARKGVAEAREWLKTGVRPSDPEWRLDEITFRPTSGFGNRGVVAA